MSQAELAITLAVLSSEAIEALKRSSWFPWLHAESDKLNRMAGAIAACSAGLGLSFHYDPTAHQLLVNGLAWSAIGRAVMQWAIQQAYYRLGVQKQKAPLPTETTGEPTA